MDHPLQNPGPTPESHPQAHTPRRIFLTGATGYIGGRLAPRLLRRGHRLICGVRSRAKLAERPWADDPRVEAVEVDFQDRRALAAAMAGCDVAYYLVHSMQAAGGTYADADRRLASNFAGAATDVGVAHIIYLGGLGELGPDLSDHLTSRREVESILRDSGIPVTVLRAAVIIGSGSASFEILRYLVERLPVMITPRWVSTRCQPIAIRDVLAYLVACLETPRAIGQTLDIGGPDVLSYRQMMQLMAECLGLRRRVIIPVPLLTPRLSSMWIHLVTPLDARIARPLAEGLRNEVICRNDDAHRLMPHERTPMRTAMELALAGYARGRVETSWSDAGPMPGDPDWAGGTVFTDHRTVEVNAQPEAVFEAICLVGGGHGYYAADWLWRLRGLVDRLVGGPGLRRGRRHPRNLGYGDALDFWRVTKIDRPHLLVLTAEMRLPGVASLEFRVDDAGQPDHDHAPACRPRRTLHQIARFRPRGLPGLLYWYAVLPLHAIIFRGMLRGIKRGVEVSIPPTR